MAKKKKEKTYVLYQKIRNFIDILTNKPELPFDDINAYDHIIVAMSGGKDSTACFLRLLQIGTDMSKVELWHHDIDGREGSELMDWPITEDYCRAFAKAFNVPIYYSWREGGFEQEMLRNKSYTGDVFFEVPTDTREIKLVRKESSKQERFKNTREKFPQVTADLTVRWCSSYLKIDVSKIAINNQQRFSGKKTLFITGERGEESEARSKYEQFEPHQCDRREGALKRHVDHWRPVLTWFGTDVWKIIEKYKVIPHPAYYLGWGRVSCAACIFGSRNAFASLDKINPVQIRRVSDYEKQFGLTIKRSESVLDMIAVGETYPGCNNKEMVTKVLSDKYTGEIFTDNWVLPDGAYGENCGAL